tara:strand:+ start:932 stop:1210 length:279 start_codon:yes stop_codon:yes gene_type:complete
MRAQNLDELRKTLLYQNTVDIWMTLCTEKNWEWRDADNYQRFLEFIKNEGVSLAPLKVKHAVMQFSGNPVSSYSVRLDDNTLSKIRNFEVKK